MSILNNQLKFHDVSVSAGEQVILANINVSLAAETIYTILGPSGTGKSTFIRVVAGLQEIKEGRLELNGQTYCPSQQLIGLVPQNYGLLPWQTAWQAVISAIKISNQQKRLTSQQLALVESLFTAMEINELKDAYPSQMSGGQQQRVSITRGLAIKGDFLLMDEPFSALDAFTREKAQILFRKAWQDYPKTTLFITHDIEEAILLGQKIILMAGKPGEIINVIDNPLSRHKGDQANLRDEPAFYQLVQSIRKELAKE